MDDELFQQMLATSFSPQIQACLASVDAIAGYKLSAADRQPFLYFHDYITNPQPKFITEWRSDPATEKRYHKFVNGILHDVQNAFACVLYHYENLKTLEAQLLEALERQNYRQVIGNSTMGLGNTLRLDFEYQAFVLALRRCLDYLARAVCVYFKNDFHSFRRLSSFLAKSKPESVAHALIETHQKFVPLFDFVLSEGERKSLRDKISHYEYVQAGTINLSRRGIVLAGGGENLGLGHPQGAITLTEVLDKHVANLRMCLREVITKYVNAVRVNHAADA